MIAKCFSFGRTSKKIHFCDYETLANFVMYIFCWINLSYLYYSNLPTDLPAFYFFILLITFFTYIISDAIWEVVQQIKETRLVSLLKVNDMIHEGKKSYPRLREVLIDL